VRIEYSAQQGEKRISCITITLLVSDTLMRILVMHRKSIDDAIWEEG
jgi:hypothetical protein